MDKKIVASTPVPGGAPIGSRQGGTPDASDQTALNEQGRAHHTRTERAALIRDPNFDQAGHERGSQDRSQDSQTGNEADLDTGLDNMP